LPIPTFDPPAHYIASGRGLAVRTERFHVPADPLLPDHWRRHYAYVLLSDGRILWLLVAPPLLAARRLYDIHHHAVNEHGRMDANFGIGFFLFDRLFRRLSVRHRVFNRAGFEAARERYGLVAREGRLYTSTNLAICSGISKDLK